VQKGDEDAAAAGSYRVPEGDRAAVRVDSFGLDVQEHGKRLRRECLVELEQIDVNKLEPGSRQRFAYGGDCRRRRVPQSTAIAVEQAPTAINRGVLSASAALEQTRATDPS
jgi:hypothetical protein